MKPENILQSHVLDIIFENKNKDYGAYELRTKYNKRLVKSIGLTALLAIVFALLQSWKVPHRNNHIEIALLDSGVVLRNYVIPEDKEIPKPKEIVKPESKAPKVKTDVFVPPIITRDNVVTQIAKNKDLDDVIISDVKGDGKDAPSSDLPQIKGTGGKDLVETKPAPVEPEIYSKGDVQQMAEYPGGLEALKKFILKQTRQFDDLEEGEKLVVIATFVVDKEGNIVKVEISKSARKDLDAEVIRVIKKMPQWKPAMQNNHAVSVYFKLPITFTPQD